MPSSQKTVSTLMLRRYVLLYPPEFSAEKSSPSAKARMTQAAVKKAVISVRATVNATAHPQAVLRVPAFLRTRPRCVIMRYREIPQKILIATSTSFAEYLTALRICVKTQTAKITTPFLAAIQTETVAKREISTAPAFRSAAAAIMPSAEITVCLFPSVRLLFLANLRFKTTTVTAAISNLNFHEGDFPLRESSKSLF